MFESLFDLIINCFEILFVMNDWTSIVANIGIIIIFSVILFLRSISRNKPPRFSIIFTYMFFFFIDVSLIMVIACSNYLVKENYSDGFVIFLRILIVVSYFGIGVMGILIFHLHEVNYLYKSYYNTEKILRDAQKEYYEKLLQVDREIRKFRHDIINHLYCLQNLIRVRNYSAVNSYISKMNVNLSAVVNQQYNLENEVVDCLVNFYLSRLDNSVDIEVLGKCEKEIIMDDFDICTILSNLLKNSTEALLKSNQNHKIFKISISSSDYFTRIEIVNSVSSANHCMNSGFFKTTKEDTFNHGIGLTNVRECVVKNEGLLMCEENQGIFTAIVLLPSRRID